jgi:hypothetical protein
MIEVLKQMVEALEFVNKSDDDCDFMNSECSARVEDAIEAGKQAIAELESQEPMAKLKTSNVLLRCHRCGYSDKLNMQIEYTSQPQRTWVGLTDKELDDLHRVLKIRLMGTFEIKDIYRAVEQQLKEKNT